MVCFLIFDRWLFFSRDQIGLSSARGKISAVFSMFGRKVVPFTKRDRSEKRPAGEREREGKGKSRGGGERERKGTDG